MTDISGFYLKWTDEEDDVTLAQLLWHKNIWANGPSTFYKTKQKAAEDADGDPSMDTLDSLENFSWIEGRVKFH